MIRNPRYQGIFLRIFFFVLIILNSACASMSLPVTPGATAPEQPAAQAEPPVQVQQALEEKWGVSDLSIRLASNGYMLDFRYRVNDPVKARPLFDRKVKPYLEDGRGTRFYVPNPPKIGALRNTRPPQTDRIYFIIFGNPGKTIQPGSSVTVVVGDFRAENLVVQ